MFKYLEFTKYFKINKMCKRKNINALSYDFNQQKHKQMQ